MQLADSPGTPGVTDAPYSPDLHKVFYASGPRNATVAFDALDPSDQPGALMLLMYMMHLMQPRHLKNLMQVIHLIHKKTAIYY